MDSDWQLQNAKNRLSELVDRALRQGPQTITRHGKPAAVVLSFQDYQRIKGAQNSLSSFFSRSPLRSQTLDLERARDPGRDLTL
ncbi:MAG: type II toxin-antitoxin system Phd/YefM family antitoxin [Elusimicrobia bacterium]|nr:type II toxin-antitoxin system Phd/YefM family antitoxin [Elusimicrobiota bacterium]